MAPVKDKWIKRFIIPETTRHKDGFTIYKVTSMIFLNSSHEEVSKVSIWKRYNDFKKLHSELGSLHKQLGIKESFPTFPKSRYFGRFEVEVVEERRKYALKFLEFIGRYSYLYSSDIFIAFFEASHIDNYCNDYAQSLSSDTSEDDRIVVLNNLLAIDATAHSALQAPCPTSRDVLINSCSTLSDTCTDEKESAIPQKKNESHSTNLQKTIVKTDEERSYRTIKPYIQSTVTKDCNAYEKNKNIDEKNLATLNNESKCDGLNNNVNKNSSNCNAAHSACSVTLHDKINLLQIEDSTQYILVAAGHISAAFKHESIAEYQEAFTQYKLGISCLINGVQSDSNNVRTASIKDKISKYLTRAEQLYNRHLNCNISLVNKPVSELQYYKILKIIKSVMLTLDIRVNCNRIIKTIEKSSISHEHNINKYILHRQIPYMVHLYACIETDTTVFLIQQYASGGKLWDFIELHYKVIDNLHINVIPNHIHINNQVNEESNSNENVVYKPNKEDKGEIKEHNEIERRDHSCSINGQDEVYNTEMPTIQLLEKSQKLLQSVNATLRRGNSVANRLNKSNELRNSENTLSANVIIESRKSDLILPDIHHDKSLDLNNHNIHDVIANENLSASVEDKDLKGTNSSYKGKNSHVTENIHTSVLNRNCIILDSFKNNDSFCENLTPKTTSIQCISTDNAIYKNIKNTPDEAISLSIYHNIKVNNNLTSSKDYDAYKTRYSHLYKENSTDEDQQLWQIPETIIRIWAAEILSALEALHRQGVLIFDFKPDNILLDDTGHIRLTYIVPQRNMEPSKLTYPYSSPESITFSPTILVTSATDIWSFGVILYELLTGFSFVIKHPGLFHSHSTISIPSELSENTKSLLYGMLRYYPDERLTIDEIKRHPFFTKTDWSSMISSEI